MKPRGRRRPGGLGNFWVQDYQYTTWKTEVEDDLIILPQIESVKGLENAEAIARDSLTTAMAVGPYDLSADLGVCWQPNNPKLIDALQKIQKASATAGKTTWMIGDGAALIKQGFRFFCMAEPIMLLEGTLRNMVTQLKSGVQVPTADPDRPLP